MYIFWIFLIISNMYNKDMRLIITRKELSFKKCFTCQSQEFLEIKCKYITNLYN